jgi:hypothetical protein
MRIGREIDIPAASDSAHHAAHCVALSIDIAFYRQAFQIRKGSELLYTTQDQRKRSNASGEIFTSRLSGTATTYVFNPSSVEGAEADNEQSNPKVGVQDASN